jgi:hypothetical protein
MIPLDDKLFLRLNNINGALAHICDADGTSVTYGSDSWEKGLNIAQASGFCCGEYLTTFGKAMLRLLS